MTSVSPQITTHHTHIPSPLPASPSFHFHLTHLTNTLMLWVGAGPPIQSGSAGENEPVPAAEDVRLGSEWAAAWTAPGCQPVGTPLYRTSASDLAVPMAQRLAKRHPKHQVFLSLSIPPSLSASSAGPSSGSEHPYAGRILLMVEKALSEWLNEVLQPQTQTQTQGKSDAS